MREELISDKILVGPSQFSEIQWSLSKELFKNYKIVEMQWKIMHHIFPSGKLLFKYGLANDELCQYCTEIDSIEHFFFNCIHVNKLWKKLFPGVQKDEALYGKPKMKGNWYKNIQIFKRCIVRGKRDRTSILALYELE